MKLTLESIYKKYVITELYKVVHKDPKKSFEFKGTLDAAAKQGV